jgi:hypothetical protein
MGSYSKQIAGLMVAAVVAVAAVLWIVAVTERIMQ